MYIYWKLGNSENYKKEKSLIPPKDNHYGSMYPFTLFLSTHRRTHTHISSDALMAVSMITI